MHGLFAQSSFFVVSADTQVIKQTEADNKHSIC